MDSPDSNELRELLNQVDSRESFLTFVRALVQDREDEMQTEKERPTCPYGPGVNGWENGTIEGYLDAAIAWTEDSMGGEWELPRQASWRSFAWFLYAGKYYE